MLFKRLPRSSARQAFSVLRLVMPVEANAALDFGDRVAGQPDRPIAMAAFIVIGLFQFHFGHPQMFERRLHTRLVGAGASGYESRGDCGDDEKGYDETMQLHEVSSYSVIDVRCAAPFTVSSRLVD